MTLPVGRDDQLPPPPASWPAPRDSRSSSSSSSSSSSNSSRRMASQMPLFPGFDEDLEVRLPGRGDTNFYVRIAGRELAATNGVAVVLHGGGFTGMSWAPVAGVMKRDCCVLAPDLWGHGLTSSSSIYADADTDTRDEGFDDVNGDDDSGGGGGGGSGGDGCDGGDGGGSGVDDRMSLESLAEDVKSLLVEIFTKGLLLQQQPPLRRQQEQEQEQEQEQRQPQQQPAPHPPIIPLPSQLIKECSSNTAITTAITPASSGSSSRSGGSNVSGNKTSGSIIASPASTRADPLPRNLAVADESGGSGRSSRSSGGGGGGGGSSSHSVAANAVAGRVGDDSPTKLLLVGHSLGGSLAVRVAGAAEELKRRCRGAAEVAGVVAVDVVEGTALAALDDMPEILRKIPRSFSSMECAVSWHVKTGAIRNSASAHTVVPSRLRRDEREAGGNRVVWRTDLRETKRHWRGWFEGMSKAFLELPMPKLLVVAGMDRLDTELAAAHMQGRFQLKLVYGCGHSVQEDRPDETARTIINFAVRNSVFQIKAQGGESIEGRGGGAGAGEEEELRLKLARARVQTNQSRR